MLRTSVASKNKPRSCLVQTDAALPAGPECFRCLFQRVSFQEKHIWFRVTAENPWFRTHFHLIIFYLLRNTLGVPRWGTLHSILLGLCRITCSPQNQVPPFKAQHHSLPTRKAGKLSGFYGLLVLALKEHLTEWAALLQCIATALISPKGVIECCSC